MRLCHTALPLFLAASSAFAQPTFKDATDDLGLPALNSARLTFVDLNNDLRPDIVARVGNAYRVFLLKDGKYAELPEANLPAPRGGDILTFADLDNDAIPDAIFTRYLDLKNKDYAAPTTQPIQTAWLKGNGDGTFGPATALPEARPATTSAIAVGDADGDGRPDLFLGNWYDRYGTAHTAYPADLLLQTRPGIFIRAALPDEEIAFNEDTDLGPRPLYGAVFFRESATQTLPSLLQLAYGRRWNRLYVPTEPGQYTDQAPRRGVDGDAIRHGRYPAGLRNRADEKPFRSNGNSFDAAVGDINNDGRFDLIVTEITHAWAGESSDRTRFLVQQPDGSFTSPANLSLDRPETPNAISRPAGGTTVPGPIPPIPNWNQGDIFAQLADLDHDGRLDLLLASSDYPDAAPHENRLRLYHQQPDGMFRDVTPATGLDQIGAGMISLADVNGDGALDVLVGQSYNRLTPKFLEEHHLPAAPVAKIYLNTTANLAPALTLRLVGNPARNVPMVPYNAIVRVTTGELVQTRQLLGAGGHNGKTNNPLVHIALPGSTKADKVEVIWSPALAPTVLTDLPPGPHTIRLE